MEQISLPFRIALVVLLAVAGLWFAVLRPKAGGEPASTTPPGVTGLANDVGKAKGAVAASNANAAGSEAAANAVGGSTTSSAKPAAAKPSATAKPATAAKAPAAVKPVKPAKPGLAADAAPGDPSRPLLANVDAGKVAVVLFWNKAGSDDRATRTALRAVDRHHGKVVATAIPIADVGKYEAITRGVQVLESPTVLVIGAGGKAREITGYTQAGEIDQAVSDIGGKGFEAKKAFTLTGFAKTADDVCKDFDYALSQKADPPTTASDLSNLLSMAANEQSRGARRLTKAKATGAEERELKSAMLAFSKNDGRWVADARRKLKAGGEPASVFATLVRLEDKGAGGYHAAAKKLHVRGCYAG